MDDYLDLDLNNIKVDLNKLAQAQNQQTTSQIPLSTQQNSPEGLSVALCNENSLRPEINLSTYSKRTKKSQND